MKTRFSLLLFLFLFGSQFLVACGDTTSIDASNGVPGQSLAATTSVSSDARLAIGTLKLADTEQEITGAQATELLTLWKAYRVLSDSDTTAQFELDVLVQQIEETMTSEQIQAIDDMQISAESIFEFMGSTMPQTSSTTSSTLSNEQAGGAPVEGGTPPDGGMMGDLGMVGADLQTTSDTVDQSVSKMVTINPTVLNTLIEMLETKVQASS